MNSVFESERRLLALMFQGHESGLAQRLAQYRWSEPEHEAIYRALASMPPGAAAEQLPARLTRLGFPDVDWSFLEEPHNLSRRDALNLVSELMAEL